MDLERRWELVRGKHMLEDQFSWKGESLRGRTSVRRTLLINFFLLMVIYKYQIKIFEVKVIRRVNLDRVETIFA
jgi:hypothetical protein